MVLFPVTVNTLATPNHPIFRILYRFSYLRNGWGQILCSVIVVIIIAIII